MLYPSETARGEVGKGSGDATRITWISNPGEWFRNTYHPMAGRADLQTLLPWYHQLVLARQKATEGQPQDEEQEKKEVVQRGLWQEDAVEEGE